MVTLAAAVVAIATVLLRVSRNRTHVCFGDAGCPQFSLVCRRRECSVHELVFEELVGLWVNGDPLRPVCCNGRFLGTLVLWGCKLSNSQYDIPTEPEEEVLVKKTPCLIVSMN